MKENKGKTHNYIKNLLQRKKIKGVNVDLNQFNFS